MWQAGRQAAYAAPNGLDLAPDRPVNAAAQYNALPPPTCQQRVLHAARPRRTAVAARLHQLGGREVGGITGSLQLNSDQRRTGETGAGQR